MAAGPLPPDQEEALRALLKKVEIEALAAVGTTVLVATSQPSAIVAGDFNSGWWEVGRYAVVRSQDALLAGLFPEAAEPSAWGEVEGPYGKSVLAIMAGVEPRRLGINTHLKATP